MLVRPVFSAWIWWALPATGLLIGPVNARPAAASEPATPAAYPVCKEKSPGGPVFITETCVDPVLSEAYVDVKRPGSITDPNNGITVDYTYVHGGFTGTKTRFAFYFPAADKYRGRFFETTYPTIAQEDAAADCPEVGTSACSVVFAIAHGAYVVSTNNAGGIPAGGALSPYRANAAAAKYSRVVAAQIYGTPVRPRGYLYGASGGAYQTVGSLENTSGVWDGGVPMVFGVPSAIPSFMVSQLLALRVLRNRLPQIADAVAPGGSGDPYAGLSPEQQQVLREVTRIGAPLRGWWQYATMNGGGFWAVQGAVRAIDPGYAEDFWSKPGYEGGEQSVRAARVRHDTTVAGLAGTNELVLATVPEGEVLNADLEIMEGPKAGQSFLIRAVSGNKVTLLSSAGITPGTKVRLNNSWLIALEYYPRHQISSFREYGWDQYIGPDGVPLHAQRPVLVGPLLNASSAGSIANGHFHGKMIMLESALDVSAYPWSADWYRSKAQAVHGARTPDNFRVWYMDNADHGPDLSGRTAGVAFEGAPKAADHIVGYVGEVQQALLDLDAWADKGTLPPGNSGYRIDSDNQVQLATTARQRRGVQPVVVAMAMTSPHGSPSQRVDVTAGQSVTLSMKAEVPPGAGKVVKVEWDLEGAGQFSAGAQPFAIGSKVALNQTYIPTKPGTYFPVVKVTSQRNGDAGTPFGLVENLASVRVVVH